jgi:hypothetical protein
MWSKGAQKDYLDIYDDCEEEYDEYYEEEEQKPVQSKVEIQPKIEVKVEEKPVETKVEEISEDDSTDDDYYVSQVQIKPVVYETHNEELMFDNYDNFSYDGSLEFYKKYKQANSVQNIIKRFGFKKLKSNDNNHYYLDKTLYFIWKYNKNNKTGEDELIRVDDEVWNKLRRMNDNTVIYDRYLPQPIMCF